MQITIKPKGNLSGLCTVPGDKSISHRAVMFGSIASGVTEIEGFLMGQDCLSTIGCFQALGVDVAINGDKVIVTGNGLHGLSKPAGMLDVGNSGTTLRLITGLLAGQDFSCTVTGDASIQKRPMDRVLTPLKQMGADIVGADGGTLAPLAINGTPLHGIEYTLPVASAQIKSAILLAGLYAQGETTVIEPTPSRDHTEIMLRYLGAGIEKKAGRIVCRPVKELTGSKVMVPGDISSAAYWIVAALVTPGSRLTITNVGVNVTRTGLITALRDMGGDVRVLNRRVLCGEYVADIEARHSALGPVTLSGGIIPRMIDELPIFAVAALFADGRTVIRDAGELKLKESNRINAMATELSKMGAIIEETADGLIIEGGHPLRGAEVESHVDHRVAMSLAVAGLCAEGETAINGAECVDISYPGFFETLGQL